MGNKHVVKFDHDDGVKLPRHKRVFYCGADAAKVGFNFVFTDAQHAILSIESGSLIHPCKQCMSEIVKIIKGQKDAE